MNIIYGTSAAEVMFATDGPDIIYGLQGSDAIHGQWGKDVFVLASDDIKEFIIDFEEGRDLIDLRELGIENIDQLVQMYEFDTDILQSTITQIRLYVNMMLDPEARADIDPTDFIFADTPVHTYSAGRDTVKVALNEYQIHFGNGGEDTLNLSQLAAAADGSGALVTMDDDAYGTGKFLLDGVTQHFFEFRNVAGTLGADQILGSTAGNALAGMSGDDLLQGRAGHDVLLGNVGNDLLQGGIGDDVLNGGYGWDVLSGGFGADTFAFNGRERAHDIVSDFQDGLDRLDLSAWGVTSLGQLTITANRDGSVTLSYEDGQNNVTVQGWEGDALSAGDLTGADFIFA